MNEQLKQDMTRHTQTWLIIAAMALALWPVLYYVTRLPASNPYAKCQVIFGPMDRKCETQVAIDILNRSY